ncbi:hypothetical protein, partial [Rhodococcus sp. A14]|uniref:hypothetical protein n=1 Tax=Rhodococcus sp. A14 TaxID=1194106 RepID=UPI003216C7C0
MTVFGRTMSAERAANTGAGRALRSSFPAGVSGNDSNTTIADGTMYPGNRSPTNPDNTRVSTSTPGAGN